MRLALLLLGTVLMTSASQAQTGLTTLADLQDHSRPLLIFAGKPDDPRLTIQLRTLRDHPAEAQDRQIVPLALVYNNPSPTEAKLTSTDAEATRRRFGVPPNEFTVILLGKDGGEKLRSSKPLAMDKLNDTIDSMPMRQNEMKRAKASN